MSATSAIVLFAVIWAMVFYLINPLWQKSQAEDGDVTPGTPPSAPVEAHLKFKALVATGAAVVIFAAIFAAIEFRLIPLDRIVIATPPSQR